MRNICAWRQRPIILRNIFPEPTPTFLVSAGQVVLQVHAHNSYCKQPVLHNQPHELSIAITNHTVRV